MFCEHCGIKKEEDAIFCQNCGERGGLNKIKSVNDLVEPETQLSLSGSEDIFYSKEWHQKNYFIISSLPTIDISVDDNYLYLIKLPRYNGNTIGVLVGLVLLNLIGVLIGSSIGSSSDRKKREWYRSAWVNSNGKVTSREFLNNLYKKIPLSELRGKMTFSKKKFVLRTIDKKIILGKGEVELARLKEKIKNYVL